MATRAELREAEAQAQAIEAINRIPERFDFEMSMGAAQEYIAAMQRAEIERIMAAPPLMILRPERFVDRSLDWPGMPFSEEAKQSPVAVLDKPDALSISLPEPIDAEYAELAKKIGFRLPELEKHALLTFLQQNGFHTYDLERVAAYMQSLVDKHNQDNGLTTWTGDRLVWGWRPLRKQDPPRGTFKGASGILATPYDKRIPMPVLQTVDEITEKLPDAQFYVSDYDTTKPDPFLAVTLPGMKELVVIERWDEPAFR